MRVLDAYLSGLAQAASPGALVYYEDTAMGATALRRLKDGLEKQKEMWGVSGLRDQRIGSHDSEPNWQDIADVLEIFGGAIRTMIERGGMIERRHYLEEPGREPVLLGTNMRDVRRALIAFQHARSKGGTT